MQSNEYNSEEQSTLLSQFLTILLSTPHNQILLDHHRRIPHHVHQLNLETVQLIDQLNGATDWSA